MAQNGLFQYVGYGEKGERRERGERREKGETYGLEIVSVEPGGFTGHLLVPANNLGGLAFGGGGNGDDESDDEESELSELHGDS